MIGKLFKIEYVHNLNIQIKAQFVFALTYSSTYICMCCMRSVIVKPIESQGGGGYYGRSLLHPFDGSNQIEFLILSDALLDTFVKNMSYGQRIIIENILI